VSIAGTPYQEPVYLTRGQAANGDGPGIIDVSMCNAAIQPPVILGTIGAGGDVTVKVLGSHDLVEWYDFSGGGFTADFARSVVQGIRFWKVNVSAYVTGAVTVSVGAVANFNGAVVTPNLYTRTSVVEGA
jgi:hypothetical protein